MKLASRKNGTRDGALALVSSDLSLTADAIDIAPTLQSALDHWPDCRIALEDRAKALELGTLSGTTPLELEALMAPLPRAYQFLDASAYLHHVELARKARGAEIPESLLTDPLMYQGVSAPFLAADDPIPAYPDDWGPDFEAEIGVIVDDVPQGIDPTKALDHVVLLVLINDISLRGLIPGELQKGFGFLQGKPPSALSPVAVSPNELGDAWHGGKLHLPVQIHLGEAFIGAPDAGQDMQFDFGQLIAHAAKSRPLAAGTLIGSGTVSNRDPKSGTACLVERRMEDLIETGKVQTRFLLPGQRLRIEAIAPDGSRPFGVIDQTVADA